MIAPMVARRRGHTPASQQGSDIRTASRSNHAPLLSVNDNAAITRSAAMTDLDPHDESEDPQELRSAAVDALKDAARQSDPQEFNRLTRHALALIERARAIRHGRQYAGSEAAGIRVLPKNGKEKPRSSHKIIEFIIRLWRHSP